MNVLSNSTATAFTNLFYSLTNVLAKGTGGLYGVTNSPFATVTVQLLNGGTTNLRVTEVRDISPGNQATRQYDYNWVGTGWELISGGTLRQETRTITSSGTTDRKSTRLNSSHA